jgi:non-specific serine/threonine protein kinase
LETRADADAVRLFAERARAGTPDFSLTDASTPVVAEICRRLDGLPLAIELAAARIKALPPAALLARLDQRLPILAGARRDVPQRQQTMRNAIAWSYDLLTAEEQALFRRLAIFVGGFTIESAEEIAGDLGIATVDGIASLVDKSLLHQLAHETGTARYAMLETVREYGLEQLQRNGEVATTRAAHAAAITTLVESQVDPVNWVTVATTSRLAADQDNVRAALGWALDTGDATTGLRLATAFYRIWQVRGELNEGRWWLTRLLKLESDTSSMDLRASACWMEGWFAFLQGEVGHAQRAFAETIELSQQPSCYRARAFALMGLGAVAQHQGAFDIARARYDESIALARAHGDESFVSGVFQNLGWLARDSGDFATARQYFEDDLETERAREDDWGIVLALGNLSGLAREMGDHQRAGALDRERLVLNQKLGDRLDQSLCCQAAAEGALWLGQPDRAARLAGAAAAVRVETGFQGDLSYQRDIARLETAIRAALDDESFAREWSIGQALPLDIAIAEADAIFAEEASAPPSDRLVRTLQVATATHGLTPRESEVLRLIARDLSNQQIADTLYLSRRTVHKHVENILGKLGVDSRAGAAVWAVRNGIE